MGGSSEGQLRKTHGAVRLQMKCSSITVDVAQIGRIAAITASGAQPLADIDVRAWSIVSLLTLTHMHPIVISMGYA